MTGQLGNEPMLEMYIFETGQNLELIESIVLSSEKSGNYSEEDINEIFRNMHTIKGSSAMMLFSNISALAHSIEDLFYFLREKKPVVVDYLCLSDLVLQGLDFIKTELEKIKAGNEADGDCSELVDANKELLAQLKQHNPQDGTSLNITCEENKQAYYITSEKPKPEENEGNVFKATILFEDGCEMENIRAYTIINNLRDLAEKLYYIPEDIIESDDTVRVIRSEGFKVYVKIRKTYEEMHEILMRTVFLKDMELVQLEDDSELNVLLRPQNVELNGGTIKLSEVKVPHVKEQVERDFQSPATQSIISVNVNKLDMLMDLVGEMVIAEAMVTQNPDLKGLELDNFYKAARQLHKITSELQDTVMSIRMVPLATTFQKMHRIVRDMSKKLNKEVVLELIGEETEVDKNIIEHISDPLMHLVRNSIDHGIETPEERLSKGKEKEGCVTLEAKNSGSDVLIIIRDDGKGLNKEKILKRAKENGLLIKAEEEMTEKEIYNLIFLPGFSTKDNISEFSGRGVGMDVVIKNIETIGGSVSVDSVMDEGTVITLKIPLTLAIIDGMNIRVGNSCYTVPTTAIKESFRPKDDEIICDPDGNEMIMVRGECYPIIRLHKVFDVKSYIENFSNGILIMVEQDERSLCIFADELIGQQQVVVKAMPGYIKDMVKVGGLAGCTLLGDGSISLILDISGLMNVSK